MNGVDASRDQESHDFSRGSFKPTQLVALALLVAATLAVIITFIRTQQRVRLNKRG